MTRPPTPDSLLLSLDGHLHCTPEDQHRVARAMGVVRRQALEEACRAVCCECAAGRQDVSYGASVGWLHCGDGIDPAPCCSWPIRALMEADNG